MILAEKNNIDELENSNIDFDYYAVEESESWRIDFIRELIDIRYGDLEASGMESEELSEILAFICTS